MSNTQTRRKRLRNNNNSSVDDNRDNIHSLANFECVSGSKDGALAA